MQLRDYQLRAISDVRAAYQQQRRRVCLVIPTGGGKTKTAAEMVRQAAARGKRAAWVVPRIDLVDQAADVLSGLGLSVGAVCAGARTPPQPFAAVQVATPQTLLARDERPPADFLILDEAHHAVSPKHIALVTAYPNAYVLGLTATPERGDGLGLGSLFNGLVVGPTVAELTAQGHLVPCEILRPAAKLKSGQIAQRPADAYLQSARGRKALVFSLSKKLAEQVAGDFRALGLRCEVIVDSTPGAVRAERFRELARGDLHALSGVGVFTEGFDLPPADCVILSRFFGSAGGYLQAVGRALRPSPGKSQALVLDLTGTSHDHGAPADPRSYSLEGRGIRRGEEQAVVQSYCRVCGAAISPGEACSECGTEPREGKPVTVTGEALVPFEWKRREGPEKRAATLAKWWRVAREKGYKRQWAEFKYLAVYGERPPESICILAKESMSNGAQ